MVTIASALLFLQVATWPYKASCSRMYKLKIPILVPMTGAEPKVGQTCIDSTKLAADIRNKKLGSDEDPFLRDYQVEPIFLDEFVGNSAAQQVLHFYDNSDYITLGNLDDDANFTGGIVPSPIIVGPQFSTGCKAMGTFIHRFGLVDLSTSCGAPFLVDHYKLPNVYLNMARNDESVVAYLRFMRDVGHWNRFGIVFNVGTVNDYLTGIIFWQMAIDNGFEIPYFDLVLQISDELISNMVNSKLRIFVVYVTEVMTTTFLCKAYYAGISGPMYTLLAPWFRFIDPFTQPDPFPMVDGGYCPRSVIIEQMKLTYWAGQVLEPDQNAESTKLKASIVDVTPSAFEAMLDKMTSSSRPADYSYRFLCPDVFLRSLVALGDAERRLRRKGLTLRDFIDQPLVVGNIVNQSVAESHFTGLRVGAMEYDQKTMGIVGEIYAVGMWSPSAGMKAMMIVRPKLEQSPSLNFTKSPWVVLYERTQSTEQRQIVWTTSDGKPQKDSVTVAQVTERVKYPAFAIITAFALVSSICLIGLIGLTSAVNSDIAKGPFKTFTWSKNSGFFGCVTLNIAAVLFVSEHATTEADQQFWIARIVTMVVGLSLIHGVSFNRIAAIKFAIYLRRSVALVTPKRFPRPTVHKLTQKTARSVAKEKKIEIWVRCDGAVIWETRAFVVLNGIIVAIWLGCDQLVCSLKLVTNHYDLVSDILTNYYQSTCVSSGGRMDDWLLALSLFHVVCLFVALLFAIQIRQRFRRTPEIKFACFSIINSLAIIIATMTVVQFVRCPVNNQITLAVACLVSSISTAASWALPASAKMRTLVAFLIRRK